MKQETEEQQDFVKEVTKMSVDFDRWYTDVIRKAELADWSGVRGMMVVRPYGWAMWEAITRAFDDMIKESGHENWAFPLLIPREYLMKEAEHIEGFAPEVAWVTRAGGNMEELEEPLAVRPTSETIIGPLIKRYIQSHRDLPKLTNQWNSVVRWEMRSRLFLRSREFWWQEGHTFHASGLIVPPRVAPVQVVVVPIFRDDAGREKVDRFVKEWTPQLKAAGIRHRVDWRDERPGDKYAHWELKGVPIRLNVGARDADAGQVEMVDRLTRVKVAVPISGIAKRLTAELDAFQMKLFDRALAYQRENTFELETLDEVSAHFRERGGFAWTLWCGDDGEEARIKTESGGVTIRTIDETAKPSGKCFVCGKPAKYRVSLAKAY